MIFQWLKRYLPRSLYGRAALILVLPVVTLQLVVSVVFIQRHFEGVTEQMTRASGNEIEMLRNVYETGGMGQMEPLAQTLRITASAYEGEIPMDRRRWYDFTGGVVMTTLRSTVEGIAAIQLPDDRTVNIYAQSAQGPIKLEIDRRAVSAVNPHQLIVNMIFFGILMTLIAFIYLRNQLRPITRLAKAAEAFGKGHMIPYRPAGAIEVRTAGTAFLEMRARIERQIEQRTMMLSGVSHDLRTPLTRMKLGLAMLDSAESEDLMRDVNEMQRMLDEFLSFSQGASEGESEAVDPCELITEIVADCVRAGQPVTLFEASGKGSIMMRPMAIRRAVDNLINNAIRYGDRAEVSVVLTEKSLRIQVEDDGPGIPAPQREEALKPFSRLDTARNQDQGLGVGLGLAIASDVARAHGGVLRLGESQRLGGLRADIVIAR